MRISDNRLSKSTLVTREGVNVPNDQLTSEVQLSSEITLDLSDLDLCTPEIEVLSSEDSRALAEMAATGTRYCCCSYCCFN